MKVLRSHIQILSCLVFEESFERIYEETALPLPALRADLRDLLSQGLVLGRVLNDPSDPDKLPRYDLDRLEMCSFRMTRKGQTLWQLEKQKFGL
jgi:hypothetical protein